MDNIEKIKHLVDLGILKEYKIQKNQFRCNCPFHEEKKPSFGINLGNGQYNCFACSERGKSFESFFDKIGRKYGIYFKDEYVDSLNTQNNILQSLKLPSEKPEQFNPIISNYIFRNFPDPPGEYMEKRIQNKEIRDLFEIRYSRKKDQYLIPIRNEKKELVGWVIRKFIEEKYKYKYDFYKSLVLFGLDKIDSTGKGILTEGPLDVVKTYDSGLKNCIGLLGAHMSETQEKLILKNFNELVLAVDNDKAGKICAEDVIPRLKNKIKLYRFSWITQKKDLGDLTKEDLYKEMGNLIKVK